MKILFFEMEQIQSGIDGLMGLHLIDLRHVFPEPWHQILSNFAQDEHSDETELMVVRHEQDLFQKIGIIDHHLVMYGAIISISK